MSKYSTQIEYGILNEIAFGSIGAVYSVIGTPFTKPVRILKIINTTDAPVYISDDGANDKDYIPAGGFSLYDVTANGVDSELSLAEKKQLYVRRDAIPTSGKVLVINLYARD